MLAAKMDDIEQDILRRWKKKKTTEIPDAAKDLLQVKFNGEILTNEPMSRHTYINIGGPAEFFLKPESIDDVIMAVRIAQKYHVPYYFHGSGANTLVKDGGIKGFVINVYQALTGIEVVEETDTEYHVEALAGTPFSQLIKFAKGLPATGLEEFTGIPGSVGGYVKMNAGIPGKETKDVLKSVTLLTKDLEVTEVDASKIKFSYRHSDISKTQMIVKATFTLAKAADESSVEEKIKTFADKRQEKQPLNYPNLGSVFKNPLDEEGKVKWSAGKLIDDAGIKGVRVGGARISEKHGNFIINEGNATAKDVLALIDLAKNKVKTICGVELETEIKIIGEDAV